MQEISNDTPTVCIANAIDTLRLTIDRAPTPEAGAQITRANFPQQDQSVLWRPLGKLIISEQPIEGFRWVTSFLGADTARNVFPERTTGCLFNDVINDRALQSAIVEWSGPPRTINLIVHTTTQPLWNMVDFLRKELKLTVLLPESCIDQQLRDFLDTKSGFRDFAAKHGFTSGVSRIAHGTTCRSPKEAATAILGLLSSGISAIAKPDRGEASVGLNVFHPGESRQVIDDALRVNSYFGDDQIIVEEYMHGDDVIFPSVEYFVPRDKGRTPYLTYACSMLFGRPTELCGNFIYPNQRHAAWYEPLTKAGLSLALAMQDAGYVGHFDIDSVARSDGETWMLDLNPRRTGATHVHEFAAALLGDGYQRTHSVGAIDLYGQRPVTFKEVIEVLGPCIRSPRTSAEGVMPCELTGLRQARISLMVWGLSAESVLSLRRIAEDRLRPLGFGSDAHRA